MADEDPDTPPMPEPLPLEFDEPEIDESLPSYPDGVLGDLMRQRDAILGNAHSAHTMVEHYTQLEASHQARAAEIQTQIDQYEGGDA